MVFSFLDRRDGVAYSLKSVGCNSTRELLGRVANARRHAFGAGLFILDGLIETLNRFFVSFGCSIKSFLRRIQRITVSSLLRRTPRLALRLTQSLTVLPVTLIGLAVSLYLGFKSVSAYNRWWEARTAIGTISECSREWAMHVQSLIYSGTESVPAETERVHADRIERSANGEDCKIRLVFHL